MELLELFSYDEAGFFEGPILFQVMEGVFPPDRTTKTPLPEGADHEKNFYRWDGSVWVAEPKPTKIDDLLGIVVSHKSDTLHDIEMRQLIQDLAEGVEGYRIVRGEGDDKTWSVEKIPEEEIAAQEAEAAITNFDARMSSLKERMSLAMLQGDQEQVTALQAEYQNLMNQGV